MIKTPKKRAYYPASKNEKDRLLCWLPVDELKAMKAAGKAPEQVLEDYPYGLELEVSNEAFQEYGIKLGCDAGELVAAYRKLLKAKRLPDSLVIDGASLEAMTKQRKPRKTRPLPGYSMNDDPLVEIMAKKGKTPGKKTRSMSPSFAEFEESVFFLSEDDVIRGLKPGKLPEPEMTDGDDPHTLMRDLKDKGRGE